MFTRSKLAAPGVIALLAVAVARPASGQVSTVFDPVGDTTFAFNGPFQDIVRAQITKISGHFELLLEMAGPVPATPPLPLEGRFNGRAEIWWMWALDTDPATFPPAYPFQSHYARRAEFIIYVSWDGTEFAGTVIDRRPLLTGGEAVMTDVPFFINGTIIEADLASTLIDDPASFEWLYATADWRGPVGTEGFSWIDVSWDGNNSLPVFP
jgi:hypothetical protein